MYIPTWILIIIIIVVFYYIIKRFRKIESHISTSENQENPLLEGLTNDQKQMANHIAKYKKKNGKEMPTYEEMLGLNEEEFVSWVLFRIIGPNREKLIKEMVEHEDKTGSYAKTGRKDDPAHIRFILDAFKKNKNKEVVARLQSLTDTVNKYGYKDGDNRKGDIIRDIIFDKSTLDYAELVKK